MPYRETKDHCKGKSPVSSFSMVVFVYQLIEDRRKGGNVGMRRYVCVWQGKYRGTLCTQNDKTLLSQKNPPLSTKSDRNSQI
jgi:hypothetical protein